MHIQRKWRKPQHDKKHCMYKYELITQWLCSRIHPLFLYKTHKFYSNFELNSKNETNKAYVYSSQLHLYQNTAKH